MYLLSSQSYPPPLFWWCLLRKRHSIRAKSALNSFVKHTCIKSSSNTITSVRISGKIIKLNTYIGNWSELSSIFKGLCLCRVKIVFWSWLADMIGWKQLLKRFDWFMSSAITAIQLAIVQLDKNYAIALLLLHKEQNIDLSNTTKHNCRIGYMGQLQLPTRMELPRAHRDFLLHWTTHQLNPQMKSWVQAETNIKQLTA